MRRRSVRTGRHHPVRARLVHGVAADLRPARAGTARFLGDGLVRGARLRLLVRRHGGLWPLHQGPRQQCPDRAGRRRLLRGRELYPQAARARARSWSTASRRARCARPCSPSVIPTWSSGWRSTPWCGPATARRRSPSGARSCPSSRPRTAGRSTAPSCIRSSTATIPAPPTRRWSRRSRTRSSRSTIRCRPAPMWTCARGCR